MCLAPQRRLRLPVTINGVIGAAIAACVCWSATAVASGFASARFGGEHGHPTTTNPTAIYYNPAGIGFSTGTHLFLDGSLALRRVTWEHPLDSTTTVPPGAEGADSGTAKLFNVFGGPALGVTTRFGDLALGAGFFVPFGGRATWDKNEQFVNHPLYPLAADGVQRWHGVESAITVLYFTAGAAYRIGPLALGITGNLIRSTITNTRAESTVGTGDPDPENEARSEIDVSGWQGSVAAGVMLETIQDQLWLGASYQAQPAFGPMQLTGTLTLTFEAGSPPPFHVTFDQALPDIVRLGGRYKPNETLELRLFGDWTRWSVMRTQCIAEQGSDCVVDQTGAGLPGGSVIENLRRYWNDSYGVRAGVSYWMNPELELFAGAGFETPATTDATMDPDLNDAHNIAGALGARFELVKDFFVAGSYTHIQYLSRDNIGKSQLTNAETPTRRADGGGKYSQWIGVLNANLEIEF